MEQLLLEFGLKDSIFVGLFVWMLLYVLKTTKEREDKSAEREGKLLVFLNDMKGEFAKLVGSYEKLSSDVAEIRDDINASKNKGEKRNDYDV